MKQSEELLTRVRNYVTHSAKVYSSTHQVFRQNTRYEHILERIEFCTNIICALHPQMRIIQICRIILGIRKQLEEILPCEINKSWETSRQEYNDIIDFCERTLKQ